MWRVTGMYGVKLQEAVQAGMAVLPGKENDSKPLEQRIKELLSSAPVLLLMKGTPDEPRCGFSRKVVDALRQDSIAFRHFDILQVLAPAAFSLLLALAQYCLRTYVRMRCCMHACMWSLRAGQCLRLQVHCALRFGV